MNTHRTSGGSLSGKVHHGPCYGRWVCLLLSLD